MSKCRRVRDLLGPYLYGDLNHRERATVESHLAHCEECRTEAEACRAMLAAIPRHLLRPTLEAKERITEGALRRVVFNPLDWPRRVPMSRRRLLSVVLASLLLGVWVGRMLPREAPPGVPMEASVAGTQMLLPPLKPLPVRPGALHHEATPPAPQKRSAPAPAPPARVVQTRPVAPVSPPNQALLVVARAPVRGAQSGLPGPSAAAQHPALAPPLTARVALLRPPRPEGGDDVQLAQVVEGEAPQ